MRMWNMHFMNVEIRGLPVRIDSLFLLCLWWSLNSDCPVWWHVPSSIEPHCHSQNITFTWSLMHTYAKWVGGLSVVLFNTLGICGYLCWRAVDQLLHCRESEGLSSLSYGQVACNNLHSLSFLFHVVFHDLFLLRSGFLQSLPEFIFWPILHVELTSYLLVLKPTSSVWLSPFLY